MQTIDLSVIDETYKLHNYKNLEYDDVIETLSALLEVDTGIPMQQQELMILNKVLDPKNTFRNSGILSNDLLVLKRKVIGGMSSSSSSSNSNRLPGMMGQQQQSSVNMSNPFHGLDLLNMTTPQIIQYFQKQPLLMQNLPYPFVNAIQQGDVFVVEKFLEPLLQKLRYEKMARRLEQNPFDVEAQKELEHLIQQSNIDKNYNDAIELQPESFIHVPMLYVPCEINKQKMIAFVDTGAQMSIMSKAAAEKCGLLRLLDTRFQGIAKGVGSAKIIGRVHLTEMILGRTSLTISLTVLDQKEGIDFIFGLDMLRKHKFIVDLGKGALVIPGMDGSSLETIPFLSEGDLPDVNQQQQRQPNTSTTTKDNNNNNNNTSATTSTSVIIDLDQKVQQLLLLGFLKDDAVAALKMANGNLDIAASILLERR